MLRNCIHLVLTLVVWASTVDLAAAQADMPGLEEAASPEAKRWAPVFDFDTDSCYPAPAISPAGKVNGGLRDSGSITGECRQLQQFLNANTYHRSATIEQGGSVFTVHMYALYFEKDQAVSNTHFGHRHDWEYCLVWVKDGKLTHASFSAHGEVSTKSRNELHFDPGRPNTVKVVYHKDGIATHSFRPAKADEIGDSSAENELGRWVTPTVVEWGLMHSAAVPNEVMRLKLNGHDFGSANCSVNDRHFRREIAKSPPRGYPASNAWVRAPQDVKPPRDYSVAPSKPNGLIARWHVLPGRDADRDNRAVTLAPGQRAKIVVHLPSGVRDQFRFNLKHDKRNASDRGRTDRIGHGSEVSGDAHDWSSFGTRIYLGERGGSDSAGFEVSPRGFYVDLVHSHNVTKAAPPPEPPRNWSAEPQRPSGLVARWHVLPGRDAGRDNRLVNLQPGQSARIVVHLPASVRDRFRFNLKHDKRNASDRGRTNRIGHGSSVSGDAHNWPGFGTRIYLGERSGSDKHGFNVAPNGFYVDLVLN